ncbi:MAG TPA: hypothetical protein IAD07_04205 [Candidatus Fimivicinus intestinavium]|nr:hypothetical protein [Candidatus Fimivicinus intestinavium]
MQEIKSELDTLDRAFQDLLKRAPEKRMELHERIADRLKDIVDAKIENGLKARRKQGGTKSEDDKETGPNYQMVQNWQEQAVGSGGGYAAVRPIKGETGNNSPGAIMNYLEGGHRIRPPAGGKDYRPRINVPYVEGYHFYEEASAEADRVAVEEAERFADELVGILEGKL